MLKRLSLLLLCLAAGFAPAQAADYPAHAIKMVVPFAPGGGTDVLGRIIAQRLSEQWGQPVVIENQPGASGGIGTRAVAKAEPDGYTLLMASTGALMAASAALAPEGAFDVTKFFAPITMVAAPPYLVAISPKVAANSVAELIALAKEKPKALSFGSSGIGAASHLSGALFQKEAKIELLHVPYKGTGPAVTDLLGGRIDMMFSPSTTVQSLLDGGQLKALAVTGAKRSKFFPQIPTVAESGLPGYESVGWFGLLVPAHTPKEIVDKLNKAVVAIMAEKDVIEHMAKLGAEPEPQRPEEFGRYINADVAKWSALVEEQGITIPGAGK
ncbi:MAG: tripartite tricarboxylate transporter substrate binding protein [Rhizobiales bacterium]|nr:tripartite tricarboxylate transporter substrate binding protein [Hyphomicrobiales bacterium]